jgi:two-component system nitrogen regulation response regulator NtrX
MESVLYLGCPAAERPDTERALASAALTVLWADNVAYALSELQRRDMPVLLDLSRGAAALQSARELRNQRASTLMFAVVDGRRPDLTTEAVLAGMADVFARPLGGRRVANAIARERGYQSRAHPGGRGGGVIEDLYCHSSSMREVAELISRAASMRAGVTIRGEDGTGRQLVARTIQTMQSADAPFRTIDCAAYDGEQLEVELFGLAPRAATPGANHNLEVVSRTSALHQANGGTLYLKNIAEAPSRVQSRLARVLRDREATTAETRDVVELDVRPMAGVDPGIDSSLQEGRIRDDLFRRLSVIRIDVPALRNRREDIAALANRFVRDVCAERRVPPKTLSRPALALIGALPWRGNAIELRTLVESVVNSLGVGRGIGLEDVLLHVRLDGGSVVFANGGTLRQARARFEREYISAVLEQHQGRISDAARALGIQRTNLYRKMRSLKVARDRRR